MSWDLLLKVVLATILSAGGIGGIIVATVKFSADMLADRIAKKYELKLNKELESYKTELSKREYVSKTRFDAEFAQYKELSKVFFDMAKAINALIPPGYTEIPADKQLKKELDQEHYAMASKTTVLAQDALHQNAPFIPEKFFSAFNELLKMSNQQLFAYTRRFNVGYLAPQEEKERFTHEEYNRSSEMNEKLMSLSGSIRDHLAKLDVIE